MLRLERHVSLQSFHTFGLEVYAPELIAITSPDEVPDALKLGSGPFFVLGGGSNVVWVNPPKGTFLKNEIKGIRIARETDTEAWVEVGGGVVWQDLVSWAIDHQLGGIENLSLIPGTVGAAPIQNIGAYGVELKDVFHSLEAISLTTGETKRFHKEACQFGYRDSIFKRELKGAYLISRVVLQLEKPPHTLNLSYGALKNTLEQSGISNPGIQAVSEAVISIRQSKLPDPSILGNAGSFFKNPELDKAVFEKLEQTYPKIPRYPLPDGSVKVPAGWLIEQAGWKGKRVGNVGCYEKQALVLVNHGGATGQEVWSLAQAILKSVKEKFDIDLQTEVNCL